MQTTSQTWKTLWASGNAHIETVAVIAGTTYTEISNPVISRAVMQNNLSVGNAVSASCVFSVRTSNSIPRSAEVQIKIRLTDGVTTSEWLPKGTFYISRRSVDPVTGVITLECYDALLKANADMPALLPWTTQDGDVVTTNSGEWLYFSASYPRNMADLLNDLLLILGWELDARTVINPGAIYTVDSVDAGMSIHDVFCKIAAANGGNWVITPENKLRLVPLISAAGAQTSANAVQVNGVIGEIGVGTSGTITGVRYDVSGQKILVGADTGIVLDADVSAAVAQALYTKINGYTYQSYSFSGAIYDPAAELGDYLNRLDNVHSVLYIETATLGATYRGTISAPDPGEISDEYPYIGGASKTLAVAKAYAQQVAEEQVNNLDDSLNQLSIFNRLTGGGVEQGLYLYNGKVYLNASYAQVGTLSADRLGANSISVGKLTGAISNGNWVLDLTNGTLTIGDISASNITSGTINGDNVNAKLLSIVDEYNDVIASFGNVIKLGKSDKSHAEMRPNLFAILDEGGDVYFQAGTFESNATINETIKATTSSQRDFYTMFNIASISSLTYDGTVVSSSNISFTGNKITLSNITLATLGTVVVYYNTYDPVYYFNLGTRDSGSTSGFCSVAEGYNVEASGNLCHAEGRESIASADCSHAEGLSTKAEGVGSHAEGYESEANGDYSHAEGQSEANGKCSHAEGGSTANYNYSHAEGTSKADELCAHAEGYDTLASNTGSHSEGFRTTASDYGSHAEGLNTIASKTGAHAEGGDTKASGNYSHAEGSYTKASGNYSHAEGYYTSASSAYQHVFGKYNVADSSGTYREIVGNGTSDNNRANIRTLSATGNEWIAGALSQGSDARQKDECGAIPDVSSIKAHRFKWNDNKINHDDLEHIGYYAQDVEEVAPYLVSEDASGNKSLDYIGFLCAKIETLEKRVKELERK